MTMNMAAVTIVMAGHGDLVVGRSRRRHTWSRSLPAAATLGRRHCLPPPHLVAVTARRRELRVAPPAAIPLPSPASTISALPAMPEDPDAGTFCVGCACCTLYYLFVAEPAIGVPLCASACGILSCLASLEFCGER